MIGILIGGVLLSFGSAILVADNGINLGVLLIGFGLTSLAIGMLCYLEGGKKRG